MKTIGAIIVIIVVFLFATNNVFLIPYMFAGILALGILERLDNNKQNKNY